MAPVEAPLDRGPRLRPLFRFAGGKSVRDEDDAPARDRGLAYEHRGDGVAKAPRGKVPYIEDDGVQIPDSTLIRCHIENKYGVDLDAPLSPEQRAAAWSIEKMCEEHLYFALIDIRWRDGANFAAGPAHFFDRAPAPIRPLLRRIGRGRMRKTLHLQGIGRHTREDVDRIACRDIDVRAAALGGKSYVMAEQPTSVDGFVFGVLTNLLAPLFETSVRRRIEEQANLVSYVDRIRARYFAKPPPMAGPITRAGHSGSTLSVC
jgi:glutathione S-transferase